MNPLFWLLFPVLCVLLVPLIVGICKFIRWVRFRQDWLKAIRIQRTVWEQEEIELLRGLKEEIE